MENALKEIYYRVSAGKRNGYAAVRWEKNVAKDYKCDVCQKRVDQSSITCTALIS